MRRGSPSARFRKFTPAAPGSSEGEFDLEFEAAMVGGFVEAFAILAAGDLVGGAEVGRRDVANDGSGVGVVEEIAHREADAEVVAVRGGSGADEASQAASAGGGEGRALAGRGDGPTGGAAALTTEADGRAEAAADIERARAAAGVAG